jgi:hypothetical protein
VSRVSAVGLNRRSPPRGQIRGLKLRDVSERRIEALRPEASPRAARVRELEDHPPKWLTEAIGRAPGRNKSSSGVVLAWRRAALAIDDYRRAQGVERSGRGIDHRQTSPTRQ